MNRVLSSLHLFFLSTYIISNECQLISSVKTHVYCESELVWAMKLNEEAEVDFQVLSRSFTLKLIGFIYCTWDPNSLKNSIKHLLRLRVMSVSLFITHIKNTQHLFVSFKLLFGFLLYLIKFPNVLNVLLYNLLGNDKY